MSFFFAVKGTLLATALPTAPTPPVTAETLPFTSPTPAAGTLVTAVLVSSRLLLPTQATPPNVAPTAPRVILNRPPVTLQITPACCCGWSLLASVGRERERKSQNSPHCRPSPWAPLPAPEASPPQHMLPCVQCLAAPDLLVPEGGTRVTPGMKHGRRGLWEGIEWKQNCPHDKERKNAAQLQSQTRKSQCCNAKQIPITKDAVPLPCMLANSSKSQRRMPAWEARATDSKS